MALIVNGKTIPETSTIIYDGTSLTSVKCNDVEVWHKKNILQTVDISITVKYGNALSNGTREHTINVTSSKAMSVPLTVNVIASINNNMSPKSLTISEGSISAFKTITADDDYEIVWVNTVFISEGYTITTSGQTTGQTTVMPDSGTTATRKCTITILKAA